MLGDGSTWIWNTAKELFPQATQILDRYHAKEALHRTAQSIFGATTEGNQWAEALCAELDEGKLRTIVRELRTHAVSSAEAHCFFTTALACATPSSARRIFVPLPESSNLAAKW